MGSRNGMLEKPASTPRELGTLLGPMVSISGKSVGYMFCTTLSSCGKDTKHLVATRMSWATKLWSCLSEPETSLI